MRDSGVSGPVTNQRFEQSLSQEVCSHVLPHGDTSLRHELSVKEAFVAQGISSGDLHVRRWEIRKRSR